jgi:hypothetical protein
MIGRAPSAASAETEVVVTTALVSAQFAPMLRRTANSLLLAILLII